MAHRAPVKGGYFPVPPTDTLLDIRNAISLALEQQVLPLFFEMTDEEHNYVLECIHEICSK